MGHHDMLPPAAAGWAPWHAMMTHFGDTLTGVEDIWSGANWEWPGCSAKRQNRAAQRSGEQQVPGCRWPAQFQESCLAISVVHWSSEGANPSFCREPPPLLPRDIV